MTALALTPTHIRITHTLTGARARRIASYALIVAFGALVMTSPAFADATSDLQKQGATALTWLKTAVGLILTVAVLGSGVLAAFGQMSWKTVGQVLIGCIVAGLCTAVVAALYTP